MDGKGKQKMMVVMGRRGEVKKEKYTNSSSGDDEYGHQQKMGPLEDVDFVCNKKKRVMTSSTSGGGRRGSSSGGGGGGMLKCCQADKCSADLSDSKPYHKRHKVCEPHAKAEVVVVGGIRQRFCQQCSRFHELLEFDDTKRSCRRRLAGHNERRRKSISAESHSEGSSLEVTCYQLDDNACGIADDRKELR